MKKHVIILGIFYIALGILGSLYLLVAALPAAMGMELIIGPLIAGLLAIGTITGIGLLRFKTWARKRAVVVGIIYIVLGIGGLTGFPFGTILRVYIPVILMGVILGIYTPWALFFMGASGLSSDGMDMGEK